MKKEKVRVVCAWRYSLETGGRELDCMYVLPRQEEFYAEYAKHMLGEPSKVVHEVSGVLHCISLRARFQMLNLAVFEVDENFATREILEPFIKTCPLETLKKARVSF